MQELLHDLRSAARSLIRSPAFTLFVIVLLGLGIGATMAVFGVVEAVLLRPLPFPEADRLAVLWETREGSNTVHVTPGTFLSWSENNQVFDDLAAYYAGTTTLTLDNRFPERVLAGAVWSGLFKILGYEPILGRAFEEEESVPGRGQVMILSYDFWQRYFGGQADVLEQTLTLDGEVHDVIGVMPRKFSFPEDVEFWLPYVMEEGQRDNYGSHAVKVIGRLRDGVSFGEAQANMDGVAANLAVEFPDFKTGWGANVVPLYEETVGDFRGALLMFQGAVFLVLLIVFANVANLQMVRTLKRRRELAVRVALGAGRSRLVTQLTLESVLLAVVGGLLGILFGEFVLRLVAAAKSEEIPRLGEAGLSSPVLFFALGVTLTLGLFLGGINALRSGSPGAMNSDLRAGTGRGGGSIGRFGGALASLEITLAFVLLIAAGLLLNSFARLTSIDPGVRTEGVLTARIFLPGAAYPEVSNEAAFYGELLERSAALPGVRSVGLVSDLPVNGVAPWRNGFAFKGRNPLAGAEVQTFAYIRWVSPGYFETLDIPVLEGRGFDDGDVAGRPQVLLVDQAFVEQYLARENPIGKQIGDLGLGDVHLTEEPWQIVGVVGNVREATLKEVPEPHYYVNYAQAVVMPAMSVLLAADVDTESLFEPLRREVQVLDPALPVESVQTMSDLLADLLAERRFNLLLLGTFAAVALILAVAGIYGVVSYSVGQRIQEFGIRMALGATRGEVLTMVMREGAFLVGSGIGLGVLGALALGKILEAVLYQVVPTDPATYLLVILVLSTAALVAVLVPAMTATRVDPNRALRYE